MSETVKKERVSTPELRALIFEINKEYYYSIMPLNKKKMFSLPSGSLRNVIILEYDPDLFDKITLVDKDKSSKMGWTYFKTHKFDYPRLAKDFLVSELNDVIGFNYQIAHEHESGEEDESK